MITEEQILSQLDNYSSGDYNQFVDLGDAYCYLIDCRLNIFKGSGDQWAIVAEKLGYNPRAGGILLTISYFGNCLINLENYNGQDTNYYIATPINWDDFAETSDDEKLKSDAKSWNIRGRQVELSHNEKDYENAGIELPESGEIRLEEAGRLLITTQRDLLRATDEELYKSIPETLKKILVIDEWYHMDFNKLANPGISDEHLRTTYEFNKNLVGGDYPYDFESFAALFRKQEQSNSGYNQHQWQDNRPSSYETWQLIAKTITTGDGSFYKPTLEPNTHWKNWPGSGSM